MERRIKRTRRPSSNRHEMLAPLLKRILSLGPTYTMCLVSSRPTLAESVANFSSGSAWVHPGKIGNTILPKGPERILATPNSPVEIGPCSAEATAVSRILGPPEIPPRTIECHTRCETLRCPPNWLPAARELTLRRSMMLENGDQQFLHGERTAKESVQSRTPVEQNTEEDWCPIPERRKRPPFGPSGRSHGERNRLCNAQEVIGPEQRTTNWRFPTTLVARTDPDRDCTTSGDEKAIQPASTNVSGLLPGIANLQIA